MLTLFSIGKGGFFTGGWGIGGRPLASMFLDRSVRSDCCFEERELVSRSELAYKYRSQFSHLFSE